MLAQLVKLWISTQRRDLYPNVNYSARYIFCQTDNADILHKLPTTYLTFTVIDC